MKKLPCIIEAQPVIHGVLKVAFDDGCEGVVDLRPLIAKGKVFSWLNTPSHFAAVRIDEFGHSISWTDDQGYAIDLSADSIRRDAGPQAEVQKMRLNTDAGSHLVTEAECDFVVLVRLNRDFAYRKKGQEGGSGLLSFMSGRQRRRGKIWARPDSVGPESCD